MLLSHASGEVVWQFKHPTVGDAYAAILVKSPERIGIFIQGSAPERLVNQVTCGDVGIENATVVSKSLFPQILAKLDEMPRSKSESLSSFMVKQKLQGFLASRCSNEFLSLYLQHNPGLLDQVSEPGMMLNVVPEVRLAQRLHEFGLLPDSQRKKFVETVSNYALEGLDATALNDDGIRSLFTDDEFEDFVQRVRVELLPGLDDVRLDWESNHPLDEPPEEYMQSLLEFFDSLSAQFSDDEDEIRVIDRETHLAVQWIDENTPEEAERNSRQLGSIELPEKSHSTRSIFDDIDANEDKG